MLKKLIYSFIAALWALALPAQGPAVTSWLQNNTVLGSYYVQGNPTAISNGILANVQTVQYSANWVYATTKGIPSYPTGPFQDGNPSQAGNQNAIYKIPRNPVQNTGTPTATTAGNIGVFINGVSLFDFRDDVSWHNASGTLRGGPYGGVGDKVWNRDAVVAERSGFDCSKGHPAMGNYHHHQNPSAFDLDQNVLSNVCDIYAADGLYTINSAQHSPLIGYAYDGFPIYGPYAYQNTNGTGGIVRMKSGYQLRNITVRTHYANGTNVTDGPAVSTTYPLGYFREDYEYVSHSASDYLDEHNGRFCVTPEYPSGIYCYFATVDETWNSYYPYVVGPTFYGVKTGAKVTSISESTTTYVAAPVPVELVQFYGRIMPEGNMLYWETASEKDHQYFEVEFSSDGVSFSPLGKITGKGDSDTRQTYQLLHEYPEKGLNYYRLGSYDAHGAVQYSAIVVLSLGQSVPEVRVYPNPVSEILMIQTEGLKREHTLAELVDERGVIVLSKLLPQGGTLGFMEVNTLYDGRYVLYLTSDGGRTALPVVIQH